MKIKLVKSPVSKYTEAFKKQIVREYETGLLNKDQLMRKYSISGKSTVLEWCRRYGKFEYSKTKTMNGRPTKNPQNNRIRELEKKLKEAEAKLKVYEKLIDITSRELQTDIVKKIGARLSENWQQSSNQALVLSADTLALPNKPIINPQPEEGKERAKGKSRKRK